MHRSSTSPPFILQPATSCSGLAMLACDFSPASVIALPANSDFALQALFFMVQAPFAAHSQAMFRLPPSDLRPPPHTSMVRFISRGSRMSRASFSLLLYSISVWICLNNGEATLANSSIIPGVGIAR